MDNIREMSKKIARGSIVCAATARLVEQILVEVHETQIAPRDGRIKYLEDVCLSLGSPEHAVRRVDHIYERSNRQQRMLRTLIDEIERLASHSGLSLTRNGGPAIERATAAAKEARQLIGSDGE